MRTFRIGADAGAMHQIVVTTGARIVSSVASGIAMSGTNVANIVTSSLRSTLSEGLSVVISAKTSIAGAGLWKYASAVASAIKCRTNEALAAVRKTVGAVLEAFVKTSGTAELAGKKTSASTVVTKFGTGVAAVVVGVLRRVSQLDYDNGVLQRSSVYNNMKMSEMDYKFTMEGDG